MEDRLPFSVWIYKYKLSSGVILDVYKQSIDTVGKEFKDSFFLIPSSRFG
jgi:hypothetical protein